VAGHANYNRDALGEPLSLADHPQILGHEIAGVVDALGSAVRGGELAPGVRVVVDQGRTCISEAREPACEYCRTGDSHQCEHYREHGITGLPGGFAEFVTVPAVNVVPLRSMLSAEETALAEPLGCVVHSMEVLARAPARYSVSNGHAGRARTILICGGGPAGLLFTQYFRRVLKFDGTLLLSEPSARKRALAEAWGAETIDPSGGGIVDRVRERTDGRAIEVLIDASGAGEIFRSMPGLIRKQATVLLYGHGHAGQDLSVLNQLQFLEPTFLSPVGASGGHDERGRPLTYERALRLIEGGTIDVASLITHRYASLEAVPSVFGGDHLRADYVKGVVLP